MNQNVQRTSRREFVTGATAAGMTLAAALAAATNAAMAESVPTVNSVPEAWDIETDVVVMGYGFAGEASAISAAAGAYRLSRQASARASMSAR